MYLAREHTIVACAAAQATRDLLDARIIVAPPDQLVARLLDAAIEFFARPVSPDIVMSLAVAIEVAVLTTALIAPAVTDVALADPEHIIVDPTVFAAFDLDHYFVTAAAAVDAAARLDTGGVDETAT